MMNDKIKISLVLVCVTVMVLGVLGYNKFGSDDSQTKGENMTQAASQDVVTNANSAWSKRCNESQKGSENQKPNCEIFQILTVTKTKQKFLEFALGYGGNPASANAVIVLPLGLQLNKGGLLQIDKQEGGEKFSLETCLPSGCVARFKIKPEFLKGMMGGQNLYISIVDTHGKVMKIKLSLQGFDTTLKSLWT